MWKVCNETIIDIKYDKRYQQTVSAKELHTITRRLGDETITTDDKETEINTPCTYQWILTPDEQLCVNDSCWFATQTYFQRMVTSLCVSVNLWQILVYVRYTKSTHSWYKFDERRWFASLISEERLKTKKGEFDNSAYFPFSFWLSGKCENLYLLFNLFMSVFKAVKQTKLNAYSMAHCSWNNDSGIICYIYVKMYALLPFGITKRTEWQSKMMQKSITGNYRKKCRYFVKVSTTAIRECKLPAAIIADRVFISWTPVPWLPSMR